MRLPTLAATVITALVVTVAPAAADDPPAAGVSAQDSAFMTAAGYAGNYEVGAGALAKARGSSQGVRDFGARMISDHNKAGARLASLARDAGSSIPNLPDSAQQNIITAFGRLNGVAFDCSYVPTEYMDHVAAIGLFENEIAHGDNLNLVRFASETLPVIKEHRSMLARELLALDCSEA